jgi:hypothetical protein
MVRVPVAQLALVTTPVTETTLLAAVAALAVQMGEMVVLLFVALAEITAAVEVAL